VEFVHTANGVSQEPRSRTNTKEEEFECVESRASNTQSMMTDNQLAGSSGVEDKVRFPSDRKMINL